MADWTPWLDDAIHEINQRWGQPLDDSDQPDMEPLPESIVRETAMAILTPALTEVERLRAAMRAAMDATGSSTLHYHLLRDALSEERP